MRNTLSYVVIALAVAVAIWVVLGSPSPWLSAACLKDNLFIASEIGFAWLAGIEVARSRGRIG